MTKNLSKKIILALFSCAVLAGGSAFANDASQGVDTHINDDSGPGYLYYDSSKDRWYAVRSNGSVWDSVDGKYLRNNAVTNVTTGVANETTNRINDIANESKAQTDADKDLSNQIDNMTNNGVKYTDDTHSKVSLSPSGTKIHNVKESTVSKDSSDAITGNQLYQRKQEVEQTTADRKAGVSKETSARKAADDALNDRIGSLTGKDSNYLTSSGSLSSNLSKLDKAANDVEKNLNQEQKDFDSIMNKITSEREEEDSALDAAIGRLDGSGSFVKKNKSLSDNLTSLDNQINPLKDKLSEEAKKNEHAFDSEITDREKADKELMDRIGSFEDSDEVIYIDKKADVSSNLVTLDKETKNTADAIQKEVHDRNAQLSSVSDKFQSKITGMKADVASIGANGAALSSLEYDDYDPKSKWSFSAGQGNYRNKNSSAIGLKYNFGANSSLQAATTLGNRKNLYGASLTVRPGSPSEMKEISPEMKELMAINQMAHKMQAQKSDIETLLFGDEQEQEDK